MSRTKYYVPMPMLLPLDIQMFSDGFDLSPEDRDVLFGQYQQEVETVLGPEDTGTEDEIVEGEDEEDELDTEDIEPEDENADTDADPEDENLDHMSEDEQRRNAAFADMRRQKEEAERQAAFVKQMADHYGMTPEQLQQQWADDQLAQQAEKLGVPVDFLRQQTQDRQEVQSLRQQVENQNVRAQVAETMTKYNATQDEINAAVTYAQENGLTQMIFSGALPFEQAYKLAHVDSLIGSAEKKAVQKSLSNKKARQKAAAPAPSGGAAEVDEDDLDAKAAAYAAKLIADNNFMQGETTCQSQI